jgi:hypothetical protein
VSDEVSALPFIVEPISITPAPKPVKVATPDITLLQSSALPVDSMTDLVFRDIGGHEIINVARQNLVNGQNVSYQLIGDIRDLEQEYNSKNIIPMPGSSDKYFNSKPIDLLSHIPNVGNGANGEHIYLENGVSFETSTGDIVINVVNLLPGEQVEIEIITPDMLFDDTMY